MRKILVALAVSAFATTASALIDGTAHDFYSNSYLTTTATGASVCRACHAPHGTTSAGGAPLWNTSRTLRSPTTYYSTVNVGQNTSVGVSGTQTCLSCHMNGTTGDTGLLTNMPTAMTVGTDISNDHPVGNATTFVPGTTGWKANFTLGADSFSNGTTYTVECSTCHDVHAENIQTGSALLKSFTGGDFCRACHDK